MSAPVPAKDQLAPLQVARGDVLPLGSSGNTRIVVDKIEVRWVEGPAGRRLRLVIEGDQA